MYEQLRSAKSCEWKLDTRYQSRDFLHSLAPPPKDPFLFHFMKSVSPFLWEQFTLATQPPTFIHFLVYSGQNNVHCLHSLFLQRQLTLFVWNWQCHFFPPFQTQTLSQNKKKRRWCPPGITHVLNRPKHSVCLRFHVSTALSLLFLVVFKEVYYEKWRQEIFFNCLRLAQQGEDSETALKSWIYRSRGPEKIWLWYNNGDKHKKHQLVGHEWKLSRRKMIIQEKGIHLGVNSLEQKGFLHPEQML